MNLSDVSDEDELGSTLGAELMQAIQNAKEASDSNQATAIKFQDAQERQKAEICKMVFASKDTLSFIDMSSCNLSPPSLISFLVDTLPYMKCFANKSSDSKTQAELNISSCNLSTEDVKRACYNLNMQLAGVGTLHLSNNKIDDGCLLDVASKFPSLQRLHLHSTDVNLYSTAFLRGLHDLNLLNIDSTHCDEKSTKQLLDCMQYRASFEKSTPLTVWMRYNQPITARWSALLDFCSTASNASNANMFEIEHDLLDPHSRGIPRKRLLTHDVVELHLKTKGLDTLVVNMRKVPSTSSVFRLAQNSATYLNKALLRLQSNSKYYVRGREREFVETFLASPTWTALLQKRFVLKKIQLLETNKHTNQNLACRKITIDKCILGKPIAYKQVKICVCIHEEGIHEVAQ